MRNQSSSFGPAGRQTGKMPVPPKKATDRVEISWNPYQPCRADDGRDAHSTEENAILPRPPRSPLHNPRPLPGQLCQFTINRFTERVVQQLMDFLNTGRHVPWHNQIHIRQ